MKSRFVIWLSLLLGMAVCGPPSGAQEAPPPSEYQVKAAFLYNFAKFIEWPPGAFARTNSPITIGILGPDPFGDSLQRTIQNKNIHGRPLNIRQLVSPADAALKQCRIIFICQASQSRLEEILQTAKGGNILTVGEMEGFTRAGGIINFVTEEKKVRFEINEEAATRSGIKISSKLLSLAKKPEIRR